MAGLYVACRGEDLVQARYCCFQREWVGVVVGCQRGDIVFVRAVLGCRDASLAPKRSYHRVVLLGTQACCRENYVVTKVANVSWAQWRGLS